MAGLPAMRAAGVVRLHAHRAGGVRPVRLLRDVIDGGPGVDETTKERLFEPFFSTKSDGMGMGLNICRSIIESHQGRLWVENNVDRRSTRLKITLPLQPALPEQ